MDEIKSSSGFSMNLLERAARDAQKRVDKHLIAQADMLVWKDGSTLWERQVGFEDFETKAPLQANRIFRLCSMSKPITAAAIMIQLDRGLLKLEDPISDYIPEFADMRVAVLDESGTSIVSSVPANRQITIFDLLTHTSGLGSGKSASAQWELSNPSKDSTLAEIMPSFAGSLLEFQPGEKFEYSAIMGFDVLGRICEVTSGMSFDQFLKENLFDPLGMNDTFFNPTSEAQEQRVIKLYASTGDSFAEQDPSTSIMGGFPMNYFSGASGLSSTINDYLRFAEMLLNDGALDGVRVLSEESARAMRTPQLGEDIFGKNASIDWGLGMRVIIGNLGVLQNASFGWSGAYGTHFWIDPENNMICVFASNMTTTGGAGAPAANEFEENVMRALVLPNINKSK